MLIHALPGYFTLPHVRTDLNGLVPRGSLNVPENEKPPPQPNPGVTLPPFRPAATKTILNVVCVLQTVVEVVLPKIEIDLTLRGLTTPTLTGIPPINISGLLLPTEAAF